MDTCVNKTIVIHVGMTGRIISGCQNVRGGENVHVTRGWGRVFP